MRSIPSPRSRLAAPSSARWALVLAAAAVMAGGVERRVHGDVLAGWDFSTLTGGANNWGPSPYAPATTAANLSVVGLTRGPAVSAYTTGTFTAASRAWGGNNWWNSGTAADSLDAAIARGAFITFGFTATDGYALSFSDVSPYNVRRSSTGPSLGQWQYQVGSGSFSNIGSQLTWGSTTTAPGNPQATISLSGISDLQNVPAGTPVTFRIVNYNSGTAGSVAGTWYLNDPSGAATNDFVINGGVTGTGGGNNLFWNGSSGWASTATAAGGSGTWTDGAGGWDPAKTANFGGTSGVVSVTSASAAAGLVFTTSGYTVTGGTISLTGASIDANSISVVTGSTATINSQIAGSAGLSKTGGGTLSLGGSNIFSGGIRLTGGSLAVAADAALGDPSNAIEFNGGVLAAAGSLDLGSRTLAGVSGAAGIGGIDVPAGATLTSTGVVNLSALSLPSSGTLAFNGGSTGLGSITAAATSGTAAILGPIGFGNTNRTISVAAGGTLLLDGVLTNNATLSKQGPGTLVVTQDNSSTLSRFQLGVAATTDGGTIRVSNGGALGGNQTFFNYGTIEASAPITIGGAFGGLSVGGRSATPARLAGEAIEVTGSIGFFGSGSPGPIRVTIDNASTFSGVIAGGTTSNITGLTLGGTGSLRLSGDGSGLTLPVRLADSLRASVVSDPAVFGGGVVTGGFTVGNGARLGGNGTIGGLVIESGGTLEPGTSPGTLTTTGAAVFQSGGNYNWQLFDATGTAGSSWDMLSVGGALDLAATSADPFRINLWTLSGTGPDVSGSAANFDRNQNYSWTLATAAGGISGFSADKFLVTAAATNGTGGFANSFSGGAFSVAQSGNDLNLVFTANVGPSVITITVPSGTQTQTQAGYPTLSGSVPVVKAGAGTLVLDQANTLTGSTTVQAGGLQLANGSALSASKLVVVAGGTGQVAPYLATSVASLDLASGNGLMDLSNGALTIAGGMTATDLVAEILEGRGDGSWTGTSGITSSVAAAQVASSIPRAVGWVDNGDGSLSVAYAAPGDTNIDWSIDILDASNFLAGGKFDSGSPAIWIEGDFSYDGVVDILDAADFFATGLYDAGNYNTAPGLSGGVAAVPEPTLSAGLGLAAAAVALSLRRRRR